MLPSSTLCEIRSYPQNVDSQTSADSFTAPDSSINKEVVDPAGIFNLYR